MQNKNYLQFIFLKDNICSWSSNMSHNRNHMWGVYTPYTGSLIIRGIGYRAFAVVNDTISGKLAIFQNSFLGLGLLWNNFYLFENSFLRYFIIRAGHTRDLYQPVFQGVYIKTLKKDRKLTIYGPNKQKIFSLLHDISVYRKPSMYTGRGVRIKHLSVIKKAGKKDKQKGKAF